MKFYNEKAEEVLERLGSSQQGLTNAESEARLERDGKNYFVLLGNEKVELSPEKESRLFANDVPSQDIVRGVRPEHISLTEGGVPAKVDVSEMMGSSIHLHVTSEGKDVIIIVPSEGGVCHFDMGSVVSFTFKGNVVHVFSRETDLNLEF